MNADQVIALVGVCSGSAVGVAGVIAGVLSSGRQLKSAETLAREERRAARLKDAYADLYEWLDAWNHAVTSIAVRATNDDPDPAAGVDLGDLRSRAVRGSVAWSRTLREQVTAFERQASTIVGDVMDERRRRAEGARTSAEWKQGIGQRMEKLDELLEAIRTELNSDLDG